MNIFEDRELLIKGLNYISKRVDDYYWGFDYNLYYKASIVKNIVKCITQNTPENYLIADKEEPKNIFYTRGKLPDDKSKIKSTFARYVRRELKLGVEQLSDNQLEFLGKQLAIKLITPTYIDKHIKFLSGSDIQKFYNDCDDTCHSCMTGLNSVNVGLYGLNPDKVQLISFNDKRGLLWTTDDDQKYLDRIYPSDGNAENFILQSWAKSKGYIVKDNSGILPKMVITLNHNNRFPYMDTFVYGKLDGNKIIVSNSPIKKLSGILQNQDGSYRKEPSCKYCGNTKYDTKNIFHNIYSHNKHCYTYICQHCLYKEALSECNRCCDKTFTKEMYKKKDKIYCKDCARQMFKSCQFGCGNLLVDNYYKIVVNGFTKHICKDCADDWFTCCGCNNTFEKQDNLNIHRNRFYCNNCRVQ